MAARSVSASATSAPARICPIRGRLMAGADRGGRLLSIAHILPCRGGGGRRHRVEGRSCRFRSHRARYRRRDPGDGAWTGRDGDIACRRCRSDRGAGPKAAGPVLGLCRAVMAVGTGGSDPPSAQEVSGMRPEGGLHRRGGPGRACGSGESGMPGSVGSEGAGGARSAAQAVSSRRQASAKSASLRARTQPSQITVSPAAKSRCVAVARASGLLASGASLRPT